MKKFGEKLRVLRKQRGLTLRQLAAILGMKAHSHLSYIETGKNNPTADLILGIADYFNVSLDQLMRDELELE